MLKHPQIELCAFGNGQWLRLAAKAVEVEALEAQEQMLAAYPDLRALYAPGDGNTMIFALTDVTATFSSFTAPSRTLKF